MNPKKEKAILYSLLFISAALFFAFGYYHLAKFETTDEQLWKYGRIKQYWQSIENRDWKKTYINDKPGITVALFSGIGLLSEPSPESHQISDPARTQGGLFFLYDTARSEPINFAFRFPILLLSTFSLFLFFWLIRRATGSSWLALLSTIFIALNPVLVGISQIINPDSFLWIFGGLSIFSYLARLKTGENKFIVLAGIFAGFALLSKYTAVTLFLFFFLALLSKLIFDKNYNQKIQTQPKAILKEAASIFIIFLISIAVFSIFLPAVFVKPDYLFKGLSQFISWKNILAMAVPLSILSALFYFKKGLFAFLSEKIFERRKLILSATAFLFFLLLVPTFLNVWSGQKIIPFDGLRDMAYAREPKEFNFYHMLDGNGWTERNVKLLLMEVYPLFFSLSPLVLLLLIFLAIKALWKKTGDLSSFVFFPVISFFVLYFMSTVFAKVVSNVRYSIIIYPIFAFLSAVALLGLLRDLKRYNKKTLVLSALIIMITGSYSLWAIRPFYFSYANALLPQKFTIGNSWGHGSYEAAQYLNALPDAHNKIIWSNSSTVCLFFKGKCLGTRKIDLNQVRPDYFVISKRGELKAEKRFIFTNPDFTGKPSEYYFEKMKTDYDWGIFIDGHPENYVKVIKFED